MKKIWILLLMVSILCCFSGCGKEGQDKPIDIAGASDGEFVYAPQFYNLGEAYEPDYFDSFGFDIRGDELIYAIRRYSLEEPIHMHKTNLRTGETVDVPIAYERDFQVDNYAVGQAGFDGENRLHMIYELVPVDSDRASFGIRYEYRVYGSNGDLEYTADITEYIVIDNKNADITACHVTNAGEVYCLLENTDSAELLVLSREGLLTRVALKNERVLDIQPNYNEGCLLLLQRGAADSLDIGYVDATSDNVDILPSEISGDVIGIIGANDREVLLTTEQKLYRYSISDKKVEELLVWKDIDVRGEQVCFGQIENKENLYFALSNGMYFAEMLHLSLMPKAEVPEKEVVLLATFNSIEGSQLAKTVASYNKYNGKYLVKTVQMEYENGEYLLDGKSFDKLILGEQCPDLVPIDHALDWEQYASNGAIEDLALYLDQSNTLRLEDFQESILQAYTSENKLLCIPSSFSFTNVLVGKESLVGEKGFNHISDIQALLLRKQEQELFDKCTRSELLYMGWKSFVNFEAGESTFDSSDFIEFLEWLNTYTDKIDMDPVDLQRYQDGGILLRKVHLESMKDFSVNTALFGEKVVLQGYPGNGGVSIVGSDTLAIPTNSKQKAGAWDFIEYCLRYKKVNAFYSGFPTRKDMMKELCELAMQSGQRMQYFIEGVEIPISAATQEEVDMLRGLLAKGCVAAEISKTAEKEIYNIVSEEVGGYFEGQKSAEQAAEIIQSRVQLYLAERW